jgi:hypothetical protein
LINAAARVNVRDNKNISAGKAELLTELRVEPGASARRKEGKAARSKGAK